MKNLTKKQSNQQLNLSLVQNRSQPNELSCVECTLKRRIICQKRVIYGLIKPLTIKTLFDMRRPSGLNMLISWREYMVCYYEVRIVVLSKNEKSILVLVGLFLKGKRYGAANYLKKFFLIKIKNWYSSAGYGTLRYGDKFQRTTVTRKI